MIESTKSLEFLRGQADPFESAKKTNASEKRGVFENYLLDALNYVNDKQQTFSAIEEQVMTDPDSVDIEDAMLAMSEASLSLELAQNVISRITTAWNEITVTR